MKKLLLALSMFTFVFVLTACEGETVEVEKIVYVDKEVEVEKIVEVEKELPALPTADLTDINDVDGFLGRPDVQYVDLRNFDDKMKSGYIAGFEFIPFFDYLQATGAIGKDADWVWDGTEAYNQAAVEGLFDMDKTIFLMCGSGTRAGYVKDALLANGYTNVINVGGIASYTGTNKVLGDGTYNVEVQLPLPAVVDMANLDMYLGRSDVQYVDLRNFDDKMKSGYIAGFEMIPFFDYLQATNTIGKDADWVWDGTEAYMQAAVEGLFDMDKTIFLMCGSGTRAGYVMDALKANGYTNVYNVGGISSYTGTNKVLGDGTFVLDPEPKGDFVPGVHVGFDTVGQYMVTVKVNDLGAIVDVVFDAVYHGSTKQALGGDYNMRTATKGQTWAEMANDLGAFVVANQGFGDMSFTFTDFDASWDATTVPPHIIETDVANSPDAVAGVTVGMEGMIYAWNDAMMTASTDAADSIAVAVTHEQWVAAHTFGYTPGVYYGVDTVGGYMAKVTVGDNGAITDVVFDAIYHGSTKQALGADYRMRTATNGQTWAEMADDLAAFVVKYQGFGEMSFTFTEFDPTWTALTVPSHIIETDVANSPDAVAGVTVGMEGMLYAWNLAIAQASTEDLGVVETEVVYSDWVDAHRAPFMYEDGTYYGYEGGYSALVTIADGMIADVYLDALHCKDLTDPADGIKETCNTKRSYTMEEYQMNIVTNDNDTPLDDTDDFLEVAAGKLSWWQMADKLGEAVVDAQTWVNWDMTDGDFDFYGIDINNNPWFMWAADWNSTDVSLDFTTDAAVLNIVDPGEQNWNIQLVQEGLAFVKDQEYTVTFDADSTVARDITFKVIAADGTEFAHTVALTTTVTEFTFNFVFTPDSQAGKISIEMGGIVGDPNPIDTAPASVVTVDDVMIEEFDGTAVVAMTDQVIGGDFFVRQSELDAVAGVTVGVDKWMMAIEEALALAAPAPMAPELFISEYIEGGSNNKAIEIYNPTGAEVDLSVYALGEYYNAYGYNEVALTGMLAAGEVFVVCTDQVTAGNLLEAQCDMTLGYPSPVHFNGDDAVQLLKDGKVIDRIGWVSLAGGDDFAKDTTLVRNADVMYGTPFFNMDEWTKFAKDTFDYVGAHTTN